MALKKAAVGHRPQSFAIKGALLPMTLLELKSLNVDDVQSELAVKVKDAPDFFSGNPVVLSIEGLPNADADYLRAVVELCELLGFRLAGVKGDAPWLDAYAKSARLGLFPAGKARAGNIEPPVEEAPASKAPEPEQKELDLPEPIASAPSKTILTPVRSGQQVYSEGDLIVLAPVSAGAELLAVGSIHVYGPLRGRALAGVKGDESARIFCLSQEAELVSIAGHFMIDENLRTASWKAAAQVFFDQGELQVESLQVALT